MWQRYLPGPILFRRIIGGVAKKSHAPFRTLANERENTSETVHFNRSNILNGSAHKDIG